MKISFTGLILLAVTGCSILPETQPSASHDFGNPFSAPVIASPPQTQVTVEAPDWLADTRIRYRLLYASPTKIRFYAFDKWIAPPHELFKELLAASGKQWPNAMTVQLQGFEQQFSDPTHAKSLMRFSVSVVPENNQNKLPKTRDFLLQQDCPTPNAEGAIYAFSNLTHRAIDEIQAWLAASQH